MSLKSRSFARPLVLATFALLVTSAAHAQKGLAGGAVQAPDPAKPYSYVFVDPLEGQQSKAQNDGNHVGITMHGHWVVDVKNPDGTLAEHRDFENSLQGYGSELLTGLLSGYVVPSDYGLFVPTPNANPTAPCANVSNTPGCVVVRSTTTNPGSVMCQYYFCATGLTYTTVLKDDNGYGSSFQLAGTFTANQAGSISTVQVTYGACPSNIGGASSLSTVTPAAYSTTAGSGGFRILSAATISTVSVVSSQIVQITVTITFS